MAEVNGNRWNGMATRATEALRMLAARGREASERLARRRPSLLAVSILLLVLLATGQIDFSAAVLAALASVAIAGVWRTGEDGASGSEPRGLARSGLARHSEAEQGWRMIVDALPDAAVALDADGAVMHHNASFAQLFAPIAKGRALSSLLRHPELIEAVDRLGPEREPMAVELADRVPIERRVSAMLSRLPLPTSGQRGLPALLITFRDLSEQDKLAQMRADFVANASHELRTPLASLKGFVETLQGPARDDAAARERFLMLMASQAERMTHLIDDLLSLSRVEMGVHVPPRGIVDLNEVAAYVVQTLHPLAEASRASLTVVPLGRPARIRGDRDQIVQVVQNLVHNAIVYGREGGMVRLGISEEAARGDGGRRLALAVSDDGPGIAPEHLPRLTERFYRANVASSRAKGGTGLGLAIVKHIVLRHRGELAIASKLGQGSTFTITFDELR